MSNGHFFQESDKLIPHPGSDLMLQMQTDESNYFRVIISEDKNFDASKGNILEIIIEAPLKPRPRRRSDIQIPSDSTRYQADARARFRHKQLERETCGRVPHQTQRIACARRASCQGGQFKGAGS